MQSATDLNRKIFNAKTQRCEDAKESNKHVFAEIGSVVVRLSVANHLLKYLFLLCAFATWRLCADSASKLPDASSQLRDEPALNLLARPRSLPQKREG